MKFKSYKHLKTLKQEFILIVEKGSISKEINDDYSRIRVISPKNAKKRFIFQLLNPRNQDIRCHKSCFESRKYKYNVILDKMQEFDLYHNLYPTEIIFI